MHCLNNIYLAASNANIPMILSKIERDNMIDKLSYKYKYRLALPTNNNSIDIYLSQYMLIKSIYRPLNSVLKYDKSKSIIINNVSYDERGYYKYTNLLLNHVFLYKNTRIKFDIIIELNFKHVENHIEISPKIYHKLFLFKRKIKNISLPNLIINNTSSILNKINSIVV